MKKKILILSIAFISLFSFSFVGDEFFEISKNLDIFGTLYKELNYYYVDDVDPAKLMREGIDAMLKSLDPYTNFISESEIEDYRFQTTGKYGGIGALIRQKGDYVIIAEPYKDYPAQKNDLRPGDVILEIDGESAKGKNTSEVSKVLKGQPGTEVKLLIRRQWNGKKEFLKTLQREEIKVSSVPFAGMLNEEVGYIRLTNFTEKVGKDVREAFNSLKINHPEMKSIVFDLRGNPGGLLNEAINVSNVFVSKGQEIVSTKGKINEWDKLYKTLEEPVDAQMPLAVLVDRGSASASEIVSGAIQDLDRGVVVGQKTYGKGLVQTTRVLSYNTQLKVTTAKYYVPSGRCIQAIDYSHRNDDGSVGKIPDSLKTAFKTKTGRIVYDGGGIEPDTTIEMEEYPNLIISLLTEDLFFEYANEYRNKHDSIVTPDKFELTDKDFDDFVAFLSTKEYDYKTKTEEELEHLEQSVKREKYYDVISNDLKNMREKILKDKKKNDLYKFKEDIEEILMLEIVSRYYYQEGRLQASLKKDEDVNTAISILKNEDLYRSILNPVVLNTGK